MRPALKRAWPAATEPVDEKMLVERGRVVESDAFHAAKLVQSCN